MPMQYGDIAYVPIDMQWDVLHPSPVLPGWLVQSDPNLVSGVSVARIGSSSETWRPICTIICGEVRSIAPEQKWSASAAVQPLQLLVMQTRQSPTLALLALPQSRCNVASSGQRFRCGIELTAADAMSTKNEVLAVVRSAYAIATVCDIPGENAKY